MHHFTTLPVCVAGLLFTTTAISETKRDLDSHEHGASVLNIVVDDNALFLEFESPWINLVGFEHEPSTPEQVTAVETAIAMLEKPMELFVPNDEARCSVDSTDVSSTMLLEDSHAHDDEHEEDAAHHDEHDEDKEHAAHDDEHDEEKEHAAHNDEHDEDEEHAAHDDEHAEDEEHAAHDDEHAHDEEESETHSEVVAMYAFLCEDIGKLSSMDVKLFQQWQGIEDVDVQLAGPGGQSAIELNADSARIDLSSVN